jgi:hypothetical protein
MLVGADRSDYFLHFVKELSKGLMAGKRNFSQLEGRKLY